MKLQLPAHSEPCHVIVVYDGDRYIAEICQDRKQLGDFVDVARQTRGAASRDMSTGPLPASTASGMRMTLPARPSAYLSWLNAAKSLIPAR